MQVGRKKKNPYSQSDKKHYHVSWILQMRVLRKAIFLPPSSSKICINMFFMRLGKRDFPRGYEIFISWDSQFLEKVFCKNFRHSNVMYFGRCYLEYSSIVYNKFEKSDFTRNNISIMYNYTHNGLYPFRTIAKTCTKDYVLYGEKKKSEKSLANLNKGFRTLGISEVTRKKIAFACRTLSFASKPRKVWNGKGEYITHHILFITLTLPSEQLGTDTETTKTVFGAFLDRF